LRISLSSERPRQLAASDQHTENLGGALPNREKPGVPPVAVHILGGVAEAPKDLNRLVAYPHRCLRREDLRLRRFRREFEPHLLQAGGVEAEEAGRADSRDHISDLLPGKLKIGDASPECPSLLAVSDRLLVGDLGDT